MKERIKSYGERYTCVFCKAKIKKGRIFFIIVCLAIVSLGVAWISGI